MQEGVENMDKMIRTLHPLIFLFILVLIVPQFPVFADAPEIKIKGSSIVSDDGWLTLRVENSLNETITINFLNISDVNQLNPHNSVTYRLILPEINQPYIQVNYVFQVTYHSSNVTKEYIKPITVIKSDFVQKYNEMERQLGLYIPLLMVTVGICLFIGTSFVVEQIYKLVQLLRKKR